MSMLRSMDSAIGGMKAQQTKLDVVANNIANVGTTAFKASTVNFSDTLYQTSTNATAPTLNAGGTNAKSVGLGSKVSSINKLMTTGNALTTGRTLDTCIAGDGYLIASKGTTSGSIAVDTQNAEGATANISDTVYTRDGNLSLDKDGNLLTSNGYRVMGFRATGAGTTDTNGVLSVPTRVDPDAGAVAYDTSLMPLVIPDQIGPTGSEKAVTGFSIGDDGVVTATTSDGRCVLGQIAMANFKNPEGLEDSGDNMQKVSGNSGSPIVRSSAVVASGGIDNSSAFGSLKSGYLESSNVDLTAQFTDMISATRSFQAASKMISNGDELLQTITGLIR